MTKIYTVETIVPTGTWIHKIVAPDPDTAAGIAVAEIRKTQPDVPINVLNDITIH